MPKTHQHAKPDNRTYRSWEAMRSRCRNKRNKSYHLYGGRGITVCAEWEDFSVFLRDMGERPDGMTLDRLDSDKGYCPKNCRWATWDVQANNRRNALRVEYDDELVTLKDLASRTAISVSLLYSRIFTGGWSVAEAIARHKFSRNYSPDRWTPCGFCRSSGWYYLVYGKTSVRLVTRFSDGLQRVRCMKCKGRGGHWIEKKPVVQRRVAA